MDPEEDGKAEFDAPITGGSEYFPCEPHIRLLSDKSVLGLLGVKYLALCSLANGFSFKYTMPDQDFEGIDVTVHSKTHGAKRALRTSALEVQVKCTSGLRTPTDRPGMIAFSVDRHTYTHMQAESAAPRLFLVVATEPELDRRVFWENELLATTLKGYWSAPQYWDTVTFPDSKTTRTIYFPKKNFLDASSLSQLMGYSHRRDELPETLP